MKFSSQRTQIVAAFRKISREARARCGESGPEHTCHELSNAYRREKLRSKQRSARRVNARTLRVHDYRGAQGGKKLAKLSVRRKRNSKRGHSLLSQVTVGTPSRQEDNLVHTVPGPENLKESDSHEDTELSVDYDSPTLIRPNLSHAGSIRCNRPRHRRC